MSVSVAVALVVVVAVVLHCCYSCCPEGQRWNPVHHSTTNHFMAMPQAIVTAIDIYRTSATKANVLASLLRRWWRQSFALEMWHDLDKATREASASWNQPCTNAAPCLTKGPARPGRQRTSERVITYSTTLLYNHPQQSFTDHHHHPPTCRVDNWLEGDALIQLATRRKSCL